MNSLDKIIENLKSNDAVDAVFLTGSNHNNEAKTYSDIDLVVILKENKNELYSLYRWIDEVFTEAFFFDLGDLKRIEDQSDKYDNEMDLIFIAWLKKSDIKFDKSGTLTSLKQKMVDTNDIVLEKIKKNLWQKINYNYVANKRYFESNDSLYHEALELRLLYSVIEVVCGYIQFRNVAWKGEKEAVKYLKSNHQDFYDIFKSYSISNNLADKFRFYEQMVDLVFTDKYKKWTEKDEIILKKDFSVAEPDDSAVSYVKSLFE
ncbi:MAG: nucleotidyltransferase domain-containing protein [Candidatus Paceibacterota bacterium]|jgi:predicted nucleotidyltransferase